MACLEREKRPWVRAGSSMYTMLGDVSIRVEMSEASSSSVPSITATCRVPAVALARCRWAGREESLESVAALAADAARERTLIDDLLGGLMAFVLSGARRVARQRKR